MREGLSKARAWTRLACVGLGTVAVALLGDVKAASACSLAPCDAPVRLQGMEWVPGNLVYFEVTAENPGALSLRTEAGEPIPASLRTIGGALVFAPDAPIAPETTVVLEYEYACYEGYVAEPPPLPGQFTFHTFEHLPITRQPGSLYVEEYGVASPGNENQERGFVRVRMAPVADYSAFHLMTHTLTVDGQAWSPWPFVGADVQIDVQSYCRYESSDFQFDSCGGLAAVPEGRHTLSLQTTIVGHEGEIAPLTLEIETRCPGADGSLRPPTSSTPPDASDTQTGDADSNDETAAPAGGDVEAIEDPRRPSCALRVGPAPSGAAGGALLVLGLAGWYRRRARRSSRSRTTTRSRGI